jgi:hypothetical protein
MMIIATASNRIEGLETILSVERAGLAIVGTFLELTHAGRARAPFVQVNSFRGFYVVWIANSCKSSG